MKKHLPLLCLILLCTLCGCTKYKAQKIVVTAPVSIEIPDYYPTVVEVREAIFAAGHSLRWRVQDSAPGTIMMVFNMDGRESISFTIEYSSREYIVQYRGSSKKAYSLESGKVHPYFEDIALELHDAIAAKLVKTSEPTPRIRVAPAVSLDFDNAVSLDPKERKALRQRLDEEKDVDEARRLRVERIIHEGRKNDKATILIGGTSPTQKEKDVEKQNTAKEKSPEMATKKDSLTTSPVPKDMPETKVPADARKALEQKSQEQVGQTPRGGQVPALVPTAMPQETEHGHAPVKPSMNPEEQDAEKVLEQVRPQEQHLDAPALQDPTKQNPDVQGPSTQSPNIQSSDVQTPKLQDGASHPPVTPNPAILTPEEQRLLEQQYTPSTNAAGSTVMPNPAILTPEEQRLLEQQYTPSTDAASSTKVKSSDLEIPQARIVTNPLNSSATPSTPSVNPAQLPDSENSSHLAKEPKHNEQAEKAPVQQQAPIVNNEPALSTDQE